MQKQTNELTDQTNASLKKKKKIPKPKNPDKNNPSDSQKCECFECTLKLQDKANIRSMGSTM